MNRVTRLDAAKDAAKAEPEAVKCSAEQRGLRLTDALCGKRFEDAQQGPLPGTGCPRYPLHAASLRMLQRSPVEMRGWLVQGSMGSENKAVS